MSGGVSRTVAFLVLAPAAALLTGAGAVGAQGVQVALTPATQQVEPGATVTVDMTVTASGSPFNAFYAVIGWDPAALTPVSTQEGILMTGACPLRFYDFAQGAETDTIANALLCSGVSVTGPGQVYHLVFQASMTPQATQVRFLPGLQFYDAGLYVSPTYSSDATIGIGVPVGVDSPRPAGKLRLHVSPNPARERAEISFESDVPGLQRVRVIDPRGRVVWRLDDSVGTPGIRRVTWEGRDTAGRELAAGVYLVALEVAGRTVSQRFSWLR